MVSFIEGSSSFEASAVADDEGSFEHVVDEVVASDAGGLVIAHDESGGVASARLRSFLPASGEPRLDPDSAGAAQRLDIR